MKANQEKTTVKDLSYLIQTSCLRADIGLSLETLAEKICSSDHYKIYLEDEAGRLVGVIQAKQIARKILELTGRKSDEEEMLPTKAYVLNFHTGNDLAEAPVAVQASTSLRRVLELMEQNSIREIPVVDEAGCLVGTLEAKHILGHYLSAKVEMAL
ncbi:CBS domain-containing protein [Pontiellaceae bacterium B12219]|nr:CBS domain-containing protein [Pontiellaceae bacterium B12219]